MSWTAIGSPGRAPGASIGRDGLACAAGASWSLDAWVLPEGEDLLTIAAASPAAVRQRLQDRLPVVVTAAERRTLRLSTEAWCLDAPEQGEWLVVQAVVFNMSDDPASGRFLFAVRPITPAGPGSIGALEYDAGTFAVNGTAGVVLQSDPGAGWDCLPGAGRALPAASMTPAGRTAAEDSAGGCLGLAAYPYQIAPWEEADFTAYLPIRHGSTGQPAGPPLPPMQSYGLLKGTATRRWQEILRGGMQLGLPDMRLAESWDANRAHLVVLLGGGDETPDLGYYLAIAAGAGHRPEIDPRDDLAARVHLPSASSYGGDIPRAADPWDLPQVMEHARQLTRGGSVEAWELIEQILRLASPTFAWPAAVGREAGLAYGGHSPASTMAWLGLLRDQALFEAGDRLVLGAGFRGEWLDLAGEVTARQAPTRFGAVDLTLRWDAPRELVLQLATGTPPPAGYEWMLPWPAARVDAGGEWKQAQPAANGRCRVLLPPGAQMAIAHPLEDGLAGMPLLPAPR